MAANDPAPARKETRPRRRKAVVQAILGLGLDGKDGHTRVTRAERVLLLGGSADTHERMQEFTVRLGERLKASGKALGNVSARELRELADGL